MLSLVLCLSASARYDPNWASLMSRPLPQWFDEAKIGLFIHWGVFSVPSFNVAPAPSEWYWWRIAGSKVPEWVAFHNKTYGPDFKYSEFLPKFTAELWQPGQWAELFKAAGVKYVVLTSKHLDGFTNWCSELSFNWNSCDGGPRRDIVGELSAAVRAAGLRMGLYHSILEWFHPLYLQDKASNFTSRRYVDEVYYPAAVELNTKYRPDVLWADGDGEANSSYWRSPELLAWLYNDAPNKAQVLVNDRWGNDNPPIESGRHFGGYFSGSDRQQAAPILLQHKWENAFTIDGGSWAYSRMSNLSQYLNLTTILYELVSTIAYGGNILINVGPTSDGRIATIFQERLLQMGSWLGVNGEAIYNSTIWRAQNDTAAHGVELGIYYTASKATDATGHPLRVWAFAMDWPEHNELRLTQPVPQAGVTSVRMLGCSEAMSWKVADPGAAGLMILIPPMSPRQLPTLQGPWVFELQGVY